MTVIHGTTGKDQLTGPAGKDWIIGDLGDDWIAGSDGNDRLTGDTGDPNDSTSASTISSSTVMTAPRAVPEKVGVLLALQVDCDDQQ